MDREYLRNLAYAVRVYTEEDRRVRREWASNGRRGNGGGRGARRGNGGVRGARRGNGGGRGGGNGGVRGARRGNGGVRGARGGNGGVRGARRGNGGVRGARGGNGGVRGARGGNSGGRGSHVWRWHSHAEKSAFKRCISSGSMNNNSPKPTFHGHQILGDSLMVRFVRTIMGETAVSAGYCVSGLTAWSLLQRLEEGQYPLAGKIILMIGTNDLLKGTSPDAFRRNLLKILEVISTKAQQLIILTVPPVLSYEDSDTHWNLLEDYNNFIKDLTQTAPCSTQVINIAEKFCAGRKCKMEYYELFYPNEKPDGVHLNPFGLSVVKEALEALLKSEH